MILKLIARRSGESNSFIYQGSVHFTGHGVVVANFMLTATCGRFIVLQQSKIEYGYLLTELHVHHNYR